MNTTKKIDGKKMGRPSREELGLPAVKNTTVQLEEDVIAEARRVHGSLANAIRFSVGYPKYIVSGRKP